MLGLAFCSTGLAQATPIILNTTATTAPGTQAGDAFALAAQRVGALFSNPGPVFINVDFANLAPGVLGSTNLTLLALPYPTIYGSIVANANPFSAIDMQAVASLSAAATLDFRTNQMDGTVILDNDGSANNANLVIAQANGRALGFFSGPGSDANITFSSNFTWDFDPTDGITGGAFDFVGVATHEILHALGFFSGVDTVDRVSQPLGPNAPLDLNPFTVFTPLDLFRYSGPGVLDLAYGGTPYFSVNGGATSLGAFSTGAFNGDGRQASHWKDNLNLGLMDPTLANGELGILRQLDLDAMDAIGWNLAAQGAPELDPHGSRLPLAFAMVALLAVRARAGNRHTAGKYPQ